MGFSSSIYFSPDSDADLVASGTQLYPGQEIDFFFQASPTLEEEFIQPTGFSVFRIRVYDSNNNLLKTVELDTNLFSLQSGDTNSDGKIQVGETWTWKATFTLPDDLLVAGATQVRFFSTLNGIDADGELEASSPSTTFGQLLLIPEPPNPSLILEKTADVESFELFGDQIGYSFAVTNNGDRDLTGLTVSDPLIANISAVLASETSFNIGDIDLDGIFDINETWLFKGSYTAAEQDLNLDGDAIPNIATAQAFYGQQAVSDQDDAIVNYEPPVLGLQLIKEADQSSYELAGEEIVYTFTVSNTGNRGLSNVTVDDPLLTNVAAITATGSSFNIGDLDQDGILDLDEQWTFQGSLITSESDVEDIVNIATASGFYRGVEAEDSDDVTVTYDRPILSMTLVKTADRETFAAAGESILYSFTVTNTGNRSLENLAITDNLLNDQVSDVLAEGSSFNIGDTDSDGLFDVGEQWKFTGAYTTTEADALTGTIVNVAQATAAYKGSTVLSNEDDAIVNYNPPEPPDTFEGLSLGYWGQHINGGKADPTWNETAYAGTSYKNASFEVFFFGGQVQALSWGRNTTDVKMSDAVKLNGGGQFALARDAVAAVLNAERDDVNYKYTVDEIKAMVRDAFNINDGGANTWGIESLKNELSFNNNLGNDLV